MIIFRYWGLYLNYFEWGRFDCVCVCVDTVGVGSAIINNMKEKRK